MLEKVLRLLGGSILDKYQVNLMPKAYEDIDGIYTYIVDELQNNDAALKLVDAFEKMIFSLESIPFRGAERKIGMFADKGYRQLFVAKFTIIYRVNSKKRSVVIVRVIYSGRNL